MMTPLPEISSPSRTPSTTSMRSPCRLRRHWKRLLPVAVAGTLITAAVTAWDNGDWRLNLSPSEPMGIWSVTPMTPGTRLQAGDVVTLCPRLPHGYHYGWLEDNTHAANACADGGAPYVKTIVAGPGDVVHETGYGVTINGKPLSDSRSLPFTTSKPQFRLPQWRGTITLRSGQYWAYGAGDPRFSFDSRYWGPFRQVQVRGVATPVLVWKYEWMPKVKD
ncbi:S26 family signal peptidase [Acidithiobacillus ferrooxidans]|uniref:S26 family signal peptidase n=1 Tax=Acidithiobacillus ferrooxidans TaxID=920 RepID=UPI00214BE482|nr:S26 family signal peptidase [Acidithiobacillus ferrooxidans]MCR2831469.1 S26 family signal peptidase [Acidithiobacillus ferrooxidans]